MCNPKYGDGPQKCGYEIARHSLRLQLCKPPFSDGLYRVAGIGPRYTIYLYDCASPTTMMASTELRVPDHATHFAFTIVQAELQSWPLQSCGYVIALRNLHSQLCIPKYSGGVHGGVGMRSRCAACLHKCACRSTLMASTELRVWDCAIQFAFASVQAELQCWLLRSCEYGIALHFAFLQLRNPNCSDGLYGVAGTGSRYAFEHGNECTLKQFIDIVREHLI